MGLNYKILSLKPNITKRIDGKEETYKDLLSPVINTGIAINDNNCTIIVVNRYYVARPDLLSLAFYGTDSYADVLCKINGISNPFELEENMVVRIPRIDVVENLFKYGSISDTITDDATNIGQSTKKNYKKKETDKKSSNEQTVNDKNYIIDYRTNMIYY